MTDGATKYSEIFDALVTASWHHKNANRECEQLLYTGLPNVKLYISYGKPATFAGATSFGGP